MDRAKIFALAATITLVGGGGWLITQGLSERRERPPLIKKRIPNGREIQALALQKLATASCECAFQSGNVNDEGCWQNYRDAIKSYEVVRLASACTPISTSVDCITTKTGEECIVTSYDVHGYGFVCRDVQARAMEVEGSKARAAASAGRDPNEAEAAAVAVLFRRIKAGEQVGTSAESEGCVG